MPSQHLLMTTWRNTLRMPETKFSLSTHFFMQNDVEYMQDIIRNTGNELIKRKKHRQRCLYYLTNATPRGKPVSLSLRMFF